DDELVEQLISALNETTTYATVVALSGDGAHLSAGFDLSADDEDAAIAWRFARAERLLELVRTSAAVTIALARGPAIGLGADLLTACDYRIGSSNTFFKFPGSRFGVVLGTHQIVERV